MGGSLDQNRLTATGHRSPPRLQRFLKLVLDHMGPLECTGWGPMVQVLCCVRHSADEEEKYVYMGRYAFKDEAEMHLSDEEWMRLPEQVSGCLRSLTASDTEV